MQTNYFVVYVRGDVEPHVKGPFKDAASQLEAARALRRDDGIEESGIFAARVCGGQLFVDAFCGGVLDGA